VQQIIKFDSLSDHTNLLLKKYLPYLQQGTSIANYSIDTLLDFKIGTRIPMQILWHFYQNTTKRHIGTRIPMPD
jgi:hypothetical protein